MPYCLHCLHTSSIFNLVQLLVQYGSSWPTKDIFGRPWVTILISAASKGAALIKREALIREGRLFQCGYPTMTQKDYDRVTQKDYDRVTKD